MVPKKTLYCEKCGRWPKGDDGYAIASGDGVQPGNECPHPGCDGVLAKRSESWSLSCDKCGHSRHGHVRTGDACIKSGCDGKLYDASHVPLGEKAVIAGSGLAFGGFFGPLMIGFFIFILLVSLSSCFAPILMCGGY